MAPGGGMANESVLETDVLVVGSGPIGAALSRTLAAAGHRVILIDAGAQHSSRPGEHLKNAFVYQRDLDRFTPIVQGMLNPVSVAPIHSGRTVIDPLSYRPAGGSIRSAHNPRQVANKNLEAAAVSWDLEARTRLDNGRHLPRQCTQHNLYSVSLGTRTDRYQHSLRMIKTQTGQQLFTARIKYDRACPCSNVPSRIEKVGSRRQGSPPPGSSRHTHHRDSPYQLRVCLGSVV
jgi:hypothetical protein